MDEKTLNHTGQRKGPDETADFKSNTSCLEPYSGIAYDNPGAFHNTPLLFPVEARDYRIKSPDRAGATKGEQIGVGGEDGATKLLLSWSKSSLRHSSVGSPADFRFKWQRC